jgi:hypothetical protein
MWLEIRGNLHTPYVRWLANYGLHIFGMRICGYARLLSCSHPVDHTTIRLIFQVNLVGLWSSPGDKTW